MLLWTFAYMSSGGQIFSFPFRRHLGMESLDHIWISDPGVFDPKALTHHPMLVCFSSLKISLWQLTSLTRTSPSSHHLTPTVGAMVSAGRDIEKTYSDGRSRKENDPLQKHRQKGLSCG